METLSSLQARTMDWVKSNYSNAEHLIRTEEWLMQLNPEASQSLRLAALTHDMERAFPGSDSPRADPSAGPDDPIYNNAHAQRSARVVGEYLREQGAEKSLLEEVKVLICAHEFGGWPEANLLQAADSLSFLEVNVSLFLSFLDLPARASTPAAVRAKFEWMYERIQLAEARQLAEPLYQRALERLAHH